MILPDKRANRGISFGDETVAEGKCARCGSRAEITDFTRYLAHHANRICREKGWEQFTKSNTVLCDDCSETWRTRQASLSMKASALESKARAVYRNARKDGATEDEAQRGIAPAIRSDHQFKEWRKQWESWFSRRGSRGGKDYR